MKRLCIFCEHFYFTPEEQGYSDLTPGAGADYGCLKDVWSKYSFFGDFQEANKQAISCEFYKRSDDAAELGAPE